MDIKQAIKRIGWRFSTQKAFTPNQNDISALNSVIEYYNGMQKGITVNQEPFAKLYLLLTTHILRNKTRQLDTENNPDDYILKNIRLPLSYHLQEVMMYYNKLLMQEIMLPKNYDIENDKYIFEMKPDQKKEMHEHFKTIDINKMFENQLTYDQIQEMYFDRINEILRYYN